MTTLVRQAKPAQVSQKWSNVQKGHHVHPEPILPPNFGSYQAFGFPLGQMDPRSTHNNWGST